jgi:hypothetical protein
MTTIMGYPFAEGFIIQEESNENLSKYTSIRVPDTVILFPVFG